MSIIQIIVAAFVALIAIKLALVWSVDSKTFDRLVPKKPEVVTSEVKLGPLQYHLFVKFLKYKYTFTSQYT